jgi:pyruvate/2-oxoglutarate dehydrogenase complex dihydrolipoamide dehydrogenase (E3) component
MTDEQHFRVIVIGGGPAGVTAALRSSELGAKVALVERGTLGGTCTNDGCAPTRVLAKAARLVRDMDQFDSYGIHATERPQVDFSQLIARTQSIIYRLHEKKQLRSHLEAAGVRVFLNAGSAHFVDEHTIELGDGTHLTADRFIIAAGGHGRRIPFPGSELALTHEDVWRLKALPKSLAIVGGAATGCQLASIFSAFGVEVTLFEVSPQILVREDHLVGKVVQNAFVASGINVVTGINAIESMEQAAGGLVFHYTKDGQSHAHPAEAIILAVGWVGNIEALNLDVAGVRSERGYIVVDDYLRSTTPHIYAAGDITGRMMLVQSGSHEGRVAAENAVLGDGLPYKHLIVPHGGFTDPEYACVGLTEDQARKQEPDCVVTVVNYADMDRALIDDLTTGFCKLIVSQETHRILGAAVVGEQAVEVAQMIATGMAADMWVEQLAELELAYPTYTAIVGLAARRIVRQLGVMPLSEQWRTLGLEHAAEWERSDGG